MKLIFIRHADPDYAHDSLTEKGKREAELLSETIGGYGIDEVFVSPLGRAKETARYSLDKLGMEGITCDWLKEFEARFDPNLSEDAAKAYATELNKDPKTGLYEKRIVWDILPSYLADHPELLDREGWKESDIAKCGNMISEYNMVRDNFYRLLRDHGYDRVGDVFIPREGNDRTLAFFCHLGVTAIMLSLLWNVSPFVTLQNIAMAPTGVTILATEERQRGIAIFRTLRIGDVTHLLMAGEEPSFSARFCELYDNMDERH